MGKYQTKIIIAFCFLVSAVGVFLTLTAKGGVQISKVSEPVRTPAIANATTLKSTEVLAPNGKAELKVKEERSNESTTYIFSVTQKPSGTSNVIFTKTVPAGSSISIPFNIFSPDNKYIFLKQEDPSGPKYFVISGTETPIQKDDGVLEVSSTFAAKYSDYEITDVTGWGGMNLVVVNTNKVSGGVGPSFWFEVPSKSLIQLSGRFD